MQVFEIDAIGTHLRISIDTDASCEVLFQSIGERLVKFEKKFSRFIPGNWLDILNTARGGMLDADGYDMLSFALEVAKNTDGYFDPTIAATLASLGYGREEHSGHTVGYQNISLDGIEVKLSGDVILEFGGVGKGYLIDVIRSMITEFFKKTGKTARYLIDFGGDLFAHGKDWKIGLENPNNLEEVIGTILLDDFFFACSSGTKRKWGNHHHLIDPKSGKSSQDVMATFIEGSSGILVDSYATALCVMPFERACEFLYDHPNLQGVVMSNDGRIFRSPDSKSELFSN